MMPDTCCYYYKGDAVLAFQHSFSISIMIKWQLFLKRCVKFVGLAFRKMLQTFFPICVFALLQVLQQD